MSTKARKLPVTFVDLESQHCRYPVDAVDAPLLYCGQDRTAGAPYCKGHMELSYLPLYRRSDFKPRHFDPFNS